MSEVELEGFAPRSTASMTRRVLACCSKLGPSGYTRHAKQGESLLEQLPFRAAQPDSQQGEYHEREADPLENGGERVFRSAGKEHAG